MQKVLEKKVNIVIFGEDESVSRLNILSPLANPEASKKKTLIRKNIMQEFPV